MKNLLATATKFQHFVLIATNLIKTDAVVAKKNPISSFPCIQELPFNPFNDETYREKMLNKRW